MSKNIIQLRQKSMPVTVHEGGWVAKSVARHLALAALWVRIQTSLKNSLAKKYAKKLIMNLCQNC
jgi:hypothetical protein